MIYKTEEMKEAIIIHDDDLQVISDVLLLSNRLQAAIKEVEKRQMIKAIGSIRPFNIHYLELFKNDPTQWSKFIYDELLRIYKSGELR